MNTVPLDSEWVGPVATAKDWLYSEIKPVDQTFIVTVSESSGDRFNVVEPKGSRDVHVTILEGKAYYYAGQCQEEE